MDPQMTAQLFSFYDSQTGYFVGLTVEGSEQSAMDQLQPGWLFLQGRYDRLSQRVDPASGQVIDYQPARPADTDLVTHEWIGRRWVPVPTVAGLRAALVNNLTASALTLERGTDRLMRELVLSAPSHPAYARMAAIEAAVAPLRAAITAALAATTKDEIDSIRAQLSQTPP
jgi:hypothetical protein